MLTVNQLAQAFEGPNPSPSNYAAIISPELITEAEELIIAIIIITLTQADGGICTHVDRLQGGLLLKASALHYVSILAHLLQWRLLCAKMKHGCKLIWMP